MTFGSITRNLSFLGAGFALLATATPALPQDGNDEARMRRLEAEVRALQRKVFPGGDGRFFEPQISAQPTVSSTVPSTSTTAVTDILTRLDALEAQLQRQTALNEENANAIRLLSERMDTLEGGRGSTTVAATTPTATPAASTGATRNVTATATAAGPSEERVAAVQAIAKPQTDDAADDEYSYGFRLWDAGFFPEAQQQLALFVEKYPSQEDKTGARAGDSLLYLAETMIALDDTRRACIALAEFSETYPALAAGRLQSQYEANRGKVTCN